MLNWIKKHPAATILLIIVAYIIYNLLNSLFGVNLLSLSIPEQKSPSRSTTGISSPASTSGSGLYGLSGISPQTDVAERLVVQESNLSLLVKDVLETKNKIIKYAQDNGGYLVSSRVSNPQEAPTATVTIRVSSEKLEDALKYFHSLAIKVVSENLTGQDVTDQYVDIEKHIAQLETTKSRFETILAQATQISDISNLNREIINIQNQIDSYKGQKMSLEKNAELAKLTIYLSTDEMALPYTPSKPFRPAVVLKLAVRSLIGTLTTLAKLAIWLGVYSVIWVPALGIYIFLRRKFRKQTEVPK